MQLLFSRVESFFQGLGIIAGLGTLAYALVGMLAAQGRTSGRTTGAARQILRTSYLVIASLLFLGIMYLLWRPIPLQVVPGMQWLLLVAGAFIYFPSLALYLWGMQTLGLNFNASSGFGVRLLAAHQLITSGPYAYIRHPMYLAVNLVGWGGVMLFKSWSMLFFALIMIGLVRRAHREDEALAAEFGERWQEYARTVPGWMPELGNIH